MNKKLWLLPLVCFSLNAFAEKIWVSDEIEAPLRSAPDINAKIITMLPAGQGATFVKKKADYVQIKTSDGKEGWLSNYYVLRTQSVHEQLSPVKKALKEKTAELESLSQEVAIKDKEIEQLKETLKTAQTSATNATQQVEDNQRLKKELNEQNTKLATLAKELDKAKQKAADTKARYLSLARVSENAVEIDQQNRALQEKSVQFEQELQQLRTENQTLQAKIGKKEFLIGALTVLGGILAGYILSVMMPPRGRRSSRYSSSL